MNAPGWIVEALELHDSMHRMRPSDDMERLANHIAEAFPVDACVQSAIATVLVQIATVPGAPVRDPEWTERLARNAGRNVVANIASVVLGEDTHATEIVVDYLNAGEMLSRAGVPHVNPLGMPLNLEQRVMWLVEFGRVK